MSLVGLLANLADCDSYGSLQKNMYFWASWRGIGFRPTVRPNLNVANQSMFLR